MMRYRTINRPSQPLRTLASWPTAIASGIVFAVFAGVFFTTSVPFSIPTVEDACGAAPLDVRFYSSSDSVEQFLAGCGDSGRDAYRNLQIADLFYPAVVGLFMASALALALASLFPRRPAAMWLAGLAFLATGFDYLENIFAWLAIAAFPNPAATNGLLGFASAAKTTTSWLAGITLLTALLALGSRAVRRRLS